MMNMPVIEVAIGLVFMYLMLSMLCTFINEWIARWLSLRSKNLKAGLQQLLSDDEIVDEIFNHVLLRGSKQKGKDKGKNPSYIASESFSRILIDVIDKKSDCAAKLAKNSKDLTAAVKKSKISDELKEAITGLIDDGNTTVGELRNNLQTWFDNSMERASGWYKRRIQLISFGIAAALAFGLNLNTIDIGKSLWKDPVLRAAVAENAATALEKCETIENCPAFDKVTEVRNSLVAYPFKWKNENGLINPANWSWGLFFGCLITALATSLGAPFWFDILDKLNSIRSGGKKPKSTT